MIHQQTSRSHLIGHHNGGVITQTLTPTATARHFSKSHKSPTPIVRSGLGSPIVHVGFQPNQTHIQRSSLEIERPQGSNFDISAILVLPPYERQINIKTVEGEYVRIKDIETGFCYKFKASLQTPAIKQNPLNILSQVLVFEGEYLQDLQSFLQAINNTPRVAYNHDGAIFLEVRFQTVEAKNQLSLLIRSISQRRSLPVQLPIPSGIVSPSNQNISRIGHGRIVAGRQPHNIIHVNGNQSEHNFFSKTQNISLNPFSGGTPTLQRTTVQTAPPVQVNPAPSPNVQGIFQERVQIVGQNEDPSIIQQLYRNKSNQTRLTQAVQENRILKASIELLEQKNFLIIEQKTTLQMILGNMRQQIDYLRSLPPQVETREVVVQTNSSEIAILRDQVAQLNLKLSQSDIRVSEVQQELFLSRTLTEQIRNERQTTVLALTQQINYLESKIKEIAHISNGQSEEILSLKTQIVQETERCSELELEISNIAQLLQTAQLRILELSGVSGAVSRQKDYAVEIQRLNYVLHEKMGVIYQLENELSVIRSNVGEQVHNVHVEASVEFANELEAERQKFIQQYQILKEDKEIEIQRLLIRIDELIAEDQRKYHIIQELEFQLNNAIHSHDISRSNATIEVTEKVTEQLQEKLAHSRSVYEGQIQQLNEQINYYQHLSEEYQSKYGALLDQYQLLSSTQNREGQESVNSSHNESVLHLKNHITALQTERLSMLDLIENYKSQFAGRQSEVIVETEGQPPIFSNLTTETHVEGHITYTTHHHGGSSLGNQEETIEKVTYSIGDTSEVIQKVVYKTDNDPDRLIQTESIERVTTEFITGQEQVQSFQKVTFQDNYGYNQQQVTTYDVNDGEERYIHKVTVDSIEGRRVHEIDTNIVVHQEQGEMVYDIETEETNYANQGEVEGQYITHSANGSVFNSDSNFNSNVISEENVIYHGDAVNVVYEDQRESIVIQGTGFNINVPEGTQRITINEQTYRLY